ncbi:MAG: undecaprenyldiphospho-muramoylpentapeptide beta-N-acetylglucosaminyltransferase [Pseudomonadota bacterium]
MSCVMISAGGTGGHVFPALAVADELRRRGHTVVWLGSHNGPEARWVRDAGVEFHGLSVSALRGKGPLRLLFAPLQLLRAVAGAMAILWRQQPDVVLGLGGFVAGPAGLASRLLRRPLVIHEQNACAGLTNRALARIGAERVLSGFPGAFAPGVNAEVVGNPVRRAIAELPPPAERFAGREGPLRILVLGGSQGALALNQWIPRALARLADDNPVIRHQAGERALTIARDAYAESGLDDVAVEPFIDDMAAAYGWADLVICRAGALTVSEVAAAGVGALLIPFPAAVDDHQTRNAAYLSEHGAGRLWPQHELEEEALAEYIAGWMTDARKGRRGLLAMAEAARRRAPEAADVRVAEHCLEVARG